MKTTLFILSILFSTTSLFSQNMLKEGKEWSIRSFWRRTTSGDTTFYKTNIDFIQGDTAIGGVAYKKMYKSPNEDKSAAFLYSLLREEGERVYIRGVYADTVTVEGLLYDFSLNTGDSVYVANNFMPYYIDDSILFVVSGVRTTNIEGVERKEITFFNTLDGFSWYSGIGSSFGVTAYYRSLYVSIGNDVLLCCKEDGNLIYKGTDTCFFTGFVGINEHKALQDIGITLYPNPAHEKICITYNGTAQSAGVKVLNSIGTVVKEQKVFLENNAKHEIDITRLPRGVYFVQITTNTGQKTEKLIVQ